MPVKKESSSSGLKKIFFVNMGKGCSRTSFFSQIVEMDYFT